MQLGPWPKEAIFKEITFLTRGPNFLSGGSRMQGDFVVNRVASRWGRLYIFQEPDFFMKY